MGSRIESDEHYIIGLCDRALMLKAKRQHTFDFLRGDPGKRSPAGRPLPVDAYYEKLNLVIEYREKQHSEGVKIFDNKLTCSGCSRGEQRRRYDQRRREVLRQHEVQLCELDYTLFQHSGRGRLKRDAETDQAAVKRELSRFTTPFESAGSVVSARRASPALSLPRGP